MEQGLNPGQLVSAEEKMNTHIGVEEGGEGAERKRQRKRDRERRKRRGGRGGRETETGKKERERGFRTNQPF